MLGKSMDIERNPLISCVFELETTFLLLLLVYNLIRSKFPKNHRSHDSLLNLQAIYFHLYKYLWMFIFTSKEVLNIETLMSAIHS